MKSWITVNEKTTTCLNIPIAGSVYLSAPEEENDETIAKRQNIS